MNPTHVPVDNSRMVGSVASTEHVVDMAGIDVVTRTRALRAPAWAIVLAVQLLAGDGIIRLVELLVTI